MMSNKISVFYSHVCMAATQNGWDIETALKKAKECGIEYLDMSCDKEVAENPEETKQLLDRCGMKVSCLYASFDFLHDSTEISREKYIRLFECAKVLQCNKVLCVPGLLDFDDNQEKQMAVICQRLTEMCKAAEAYGITVTVENFGNIKSPCCKIAQLQYLFEHVAGLKYTYDMGNFRYCLEDLGEAYELLKKHIVHVHCKDWITVASEERKKSGSYKDISGGMLYPAAICEGELELDKWLKRLISDGYKGVLAIEHFGAYDQYLFMRKSAENIRQSVR